MATRRSAGILLFRRSNQDVEILLGHMGGPVWARRDVGAWSLPKGEPDPGEDLLDAARREFAEEIGLPAPDGQLIELGTARQRSGKVVSVWAIEGDLDPDEAVPGTFEMEWPRGSGTIHVFPEIDRVAWFPLERAREKLVAGQRPFLDRLAERLSG